MEDTTADQTRLDGANSITKLKQTSGVDVNSRCTMERGFQDGGQQHHGLDQRNRPGEFPPNFDHSNMNSDMNNYRNGPQHNEAGPGGYGKSTDNPSNAQPGSFNPSFNRGNMAMNEQHGGMPNSAASEFSDQNSHFTQYGQSNSRPGYPTHPRPGSGPLRPDMSSGGIPNYGQGGHRMMSGPHLQQQTGPTPTLNQLLQNQNSPRYPASYDQYNMNQSKGQNDASGGYNAAQNWGPPNPGMPNYQQMPGNQQYRNQNPMYGGGGGNYPNTSGDGLSPSSGSGGPSGPYGNQYSPARYPGGPQQMPGRPGMPHPGYQQQFGNQGQPVSYPATPGAPQPPASPYMSPLSKGHGDGKHSATSSPRAQENPEPTTKKKKGGKKSKQQQLQQQDAPSSSNSQEDTNKDTNSSTAASSQPPGASGTTSVASPSGSNNSASSVASGNQSNSPMPPRPPSNQMDGQQNSMPNQQGFNPNMMQQQRPMGQPPMPGGYGNKLHPSMMSGGNQMGGYPPHNAQYSQQGNYNRGPPMGGPGGYGNPNNFHNPNQMPGNNPMYQGNNMGMNRNMPNTGYPNNYPGGNMNSGYGGQYPGQPGNGMAPSQNIPNSMPTSSQAGNNMPPIPNNSMQSPSARSNMHSPNSGMSSPGPKGAQAAAQAAVIAAASTAKNMYNKTGQASPGQQSPSAPPQGPPNPTGPPQGMPTPAGPPSHPQHRMYGNRFPGPGVNQYGPPMGQRPPHSGMDNQPPPGYGQMNTGDGLPPNRMAPPNGLGQDNWGMNQMGSNTPGQMDMPPNSSNNMSTPSSSSGPLNNSAGTPNHPSMSASGIGPGRTQSSPSAQDKMTTSAGDTSTSVTQSITSPKASTCSTTMSAATPSNASVMPPPSSMPDSSQLPTTNGLPHDESSQDSQASSSSKTSTKKDHVQPSTPGSVTSTLDDSMDNINSPSWPGTPANYMQPPSSTSTPPASGQAAGTPKSGHDGAMKLYDMGNEPGRKEFLDKLFAFMEEKGSPITAMPVISKQPIDLYRLYLEVKDKGGIIEITRAKRWREISSAINVGSSGSAGFTLRKNYMKYVLAFECRQDHGGIDPAPIVAQVEAMSQKKDSKKMQAAAQSNMDSFPPGGQPYDNFQNRMGPMGNNLMPPPNSMMGGNQGMYNPGMMGQSSMPPNASVMPNNMGMPGNNAMPGRAGMMPNQSNDNMNQGYSNDNNRWNNNMQQQFPGGMQHQPPQHQNMPNNNNYPYNRPGMSSGYNGQPGNYQQGGMNQQQGGMNQQQQGGMNQQQGGMNQQQGGMNQQGGDQQFNEPFNRPNQDGFNRMGAQQPGMVTPNMPGGPGNDQYNQNRYPQQSQNMPPTSANNMYPNSFNDNRFEGQQGSNSPMPSGAPSSMRPPSIQNMSQPGLEQSGSPGPFNSRFGPNTSSAPSGPPSTTSEPRSNTPSGTPTPQQPGPATPQSLGAKQPSAPSTPQPATTPQPPATPPQMGQQSMTPVVPNTPQPGLPIPQPGPQQAGPHGPNYGPQAQQQPQPRPFDQQYSQPQGGSFMNQGPQQQPGYGMGPRPMYPGAQKPYGQGYNMPPSYNMQQQQMHQGYNNYGNQQGPPPRMGPDLLSADRSRNTPTSADGSWPLGMGQNQQQAASNYPGASISTTSPFSQAAANTSMNQQQPMGPSQPPQVPPYNLFTHKFSHPVNRMSPQRPDSKPYYSPQKMQKHQMGGQMALKKDHGFPLHSVEATQPILAKRKRLTAKDIGQTDPWRLMMSLKSGLLAESTWALDTLNILLFDDNTVYYFGLSHLPGLVEVLLEHYRKCLMDIFGEEQFANMEIETDAMHRMLKKRKRTDASDSDNSIVSSSSEGEEEEFIFDLSEPSHESLSKEDNFTRITRQGKPVEIEEESPDQCTCDLKKWDKFTGFKSSRKSWKVGIGEISSHVITHFRTHKRPNLKRYSTKVDNIEEKENMPLMDKMDDDVCRRTRSASKDSDTAPELERMDFLEPSKKVDQTNAKETESNSNLEKDTSMKDVKMELDSDDVTKDADSNTKDAFEDIKVKEEPIDSDSCTKTNKENESGSEKDSKVKVKNEEQYQKYMESLESKDEGTRTLNELKRKWERSTEETEAYELDNSTFMLTSETREDLAKRIICISNILRSLSFIPGNERDLCKNRCLLRIIGRLLMLHHRHPERKRRHSNYEKDDGEIFVTQVDDALLGGTEEEWWWECLNTLRENSLVTLANIAGQLHLNRCPEEVCRPILEGLLHWSICPSACAEDPLPSLNPAAVLSPRRLVLETLCKLCVTETNVDLLLATPPFSTVVKLLVDLVELLSNHKEQVLREFSIVLLSALVSGSTSAARVVALQRPAISLLLDFIEVFEQQANQIASSHGHSMLRDNPEMMGTSLDMLRRATVTLLHMARVPLSRKLFVRHQDRIMHLVMSQVLDTHVTSLLSDILYQCSLTEQPLTSENTNPGASSRDSGEQESSETKQEQVANVLTERLQQEDRASSASPRPDLPFPNHSESSMSSIHADSASSSPSASSTPPLQAPASSTTAPQPPSHAISHQQPQQHLISASS